MASKAAVGGAGHRSDRPGHRRAAGAAEGARAQAGDVVLDLMMPGLGGLEVARQLRDRAPATKVIILSMHSNDAVRRRGAAQRRGGLRAQAGRGARARRRDSRGARRRALSLAAALRGQAGALGDRRQGGAVRSIRHAVDARARGAAARRRGADQRRDRRAAGDRQAHRRDASREPAAQARIVKSQADLVRFAVKKGLVGVD